MPDSAALATRSGPAAAVDGLFAPGAGEDVDALLGVAAAATKIEDLQAYRVWRALRGRERLRERMSLFWHGHFATAWRKVQDAGAMARQLHTFDELGLGRRVAENRSHGTDHGAAAPVLLLGGAVVPGLHGTEPDLDDLDDGDVRVTCDFRRVHADVLRSASIDARRVLGGEFATTGAVSLGR